MPGVFRNLLLNAIEHVAERASDTEKVVTVEIRNSESKIITAINNRGEPIHPNQLSTFFEKFNFASSRKKNGLGLGTNYAYLVVKAHQGDIHVRSTEQEGTTVTVTLDTVQANAGSVRSAS